MGIKIIKKQKYIVITVLLVYMVFSGFLLSTNTVIAESDTSVGHCTGNDCTKLPNPISSDGTAAIDVPELIGRIIQAILGVVGSIALLMFIVGGLRWILSGGNEEQVTKGKNTIVWAVAGLAVVFLSYLIVYYIIDNLIKATTTS